MTREGGFSKQRQCKVLPNKACGGNKANIMRPSNLSSTCSVVRMAGECPVRSAAEGSGKTCSVIDMAED